MVLSFFLERSVSYGSWLWYQYVESRKLWHYLLSMKIDGHSSKQLNLISQRNEVHVNNITLLMSPTNTWYQAHTSLAHTTHLTHASHSSERAPHSPDAILLVCWNKTRVNMPIYTNRHITIHEYKESTRICKFVAANHLKKLTS